MERILKNERRVEGDCKRYLLRYTLVSNGFPKEEGEVYYATPKCNKVQCKSVTP